MSNEESRKEFINDFDEIQELVDLLEDADLVDIEFLLDELKVQDKDTYMDAPLQLELPDQIAGQPGVKVFIEQVSGLPRLNFKGQRDAKERVEKGDPRGMQELVITGLPWICKIAEKFGERNPDEFLDYFQEGVLGLVRAIRRWDPSKGPLATYASFWIQQRITRYIADAGSTLRHPVHVQEKKKKVIDEIRKTGKIPPDVKSADLASWLPPVSLNSDLSWVLRTSVKDQALRQTENPLPPDQYLFDDLPDTSNLEDDLVDRIYLEEVRKWFIRLDLTEKQKFVLAYRYGFNSDGDEKTLEQVGELLGVSRERVRQIEAKAIKRLRHPSRLKAIKIIDKSVKPRKNFSGNETQVLVQAAFHDLLERDVISEVDLESALHEIEVPELKRCWKILFDIPSVRQELTSKQKTIIASVIDGELHITQREIGLMKRGLVRLYRRFLARRFRA